MSTANVDHHRMENRQLEETPNWFKNYQFSTGIPEAPENLNFVGAMRLFDLYECCGAISEADGVYLPYLRSSARSCPQLLLYLFHTWEYQCNGHPVGDKTIVHAHETARYFYVFSYPFVLE
jgi:hypothetical protein